MQKSTSDWICLGDRNTSYYHTKTIIRRRKNRILKLKAESGDWITDSSVLSSMATAYFQHLYSLSNNAPAFALSIGLFPKLPESTLAALQTEISLDEVKSALFEMKPLKAPSIDGIHALFYQSQWEIVHASLLDFVRNTISGVPLDRSLNHTLISLIPKVDNPNLLSELRPISLCTVPYKLVPKVIANRLQHILPSLIGPYQASFIKGRSIIDNIIIAQEMVHSMKKKQGKGGWLAIKVDLEKAFDQLRWDFIHETLLDSGLPTSLVCTIMDCITSSSIQVLWNGAPGPSFLPRPGIHQGDPLSPYIFILCMERLSQSILGSVGKKVWKPIKLGRYEEPLTHLFFADDLLIFWPRLL